MVNLELQSGQKVLLHYFHDDGLSLRFEGVYNLNGDKGDNKQWGFYPELPIP